MAAPRVLPPDFPEPFAVEWGQDEYGIFQSFAVGNVVQRMRWIEPGTFMMGSPENEFGRYDDEVQHRVELTRGYWLADTPVTQALWEAVMGTNPSQFKDPKCPVETVSWDDCQQFIARLHEHVGGVYARLPTEAEWEYACRAGTKTATWVGDLQKGQERTAPLLDPVAWYYRNADKSLHAVGQKRANPWGFHDMLGNVWEWCVDWLSTNDAVAAQDTRAPARALRRVVRGGGWFSYASDVRAAKREALDPLRRRPDVSFRLAHGPVPRS